MRSCEIIGYDAPHAGHSKSPNSTKVTLAPLTSCIWLSGRIRIFDWSWEIFSAGLALLGEDAPPNINDAPTTMTTVARDTCLAWRNAFRKNMVIQKIVIESNYPTNHAKR